MNNKFSLIANYLSQKGLEKLIIAKFPITFINETNNKSITLTLNGYDDLDSAMEQLLNSGFVSPFEKIEFSNWEYDPVFVGSTLIGCSDFVCQLNTKTIYFTSISPERLNDILYGCPNALIHDADKLRASKRIKVRIYE